MFPGFGGQEAWAVGFARLTAAECDQIVSRADMLLRTTYGLMTGQVATWSRCDSCGYPTPGASPHRCTTALACS